MIYFASRPIAALRDGMSKAFDLPLGVGFQVGEIGLNFAQLIGLDGVGYRILTGDLDLLERG